jgi:hypothetical protein
MHKLLTCLAILCLVGCSEPPTQQSTPPRTRANVRSAPITLAPGKPLTTREPMTRLSQCYIRFNAPIPIHLVVSSGQRQLLDVTRPAVDELLPVEQVGEVFDFQWTNTSDRTVTFTYEVGN